MPVTLARPVVERILMTIMDRVKMLMTGYKPSTRIREVIRPGKNTPQHMQAIVSLGDGELNEELSRPGNPPADAWEQEYTVTVFIHASEKDPTSFDEYFSLVNANVVQAICLDGDVDWYTMGGLAIKTEWMEPDTVTTDNLNGIRIRLLVTYRVSWNDPYVSRV